ncbi:CD40 ligand [Cololabis saira]|uniref:CD40 ligand n=1 Tax=Cololabis saira TaxID=129043 RepID=UPI002AD47BF7|nr:CD40 ligand [Cololabis saira]
MINTYQTSMAPPPVPPRAGRSQPILIPATLPSRGHSKPLIRFLLGAVMLHFLLSVGGFIFLYYYNEKPAFPRSGATAARIAGRPQMPEQETSDRPLAHMIAKNATSRKPGNLEWNRSHSVFTNINTFHNSWVTILEPGSYYVYSSVTFSKGDAKVPLVSWVQLRKSESAREKVVMKAYCSLSSFSSESNPHMCTATRGEVIMLEAGNQLSVYVQDLSLIDYAEGATTFGMYKL